MYLGDSAIWESGQAQGLVWDVALFHCSNIPTRKYGLFGASENYNHCLYNGRLPLLSYPHCEI